MRIRRPFGLSSKIFSTNGRSRSRWQAIQRRLVCQYLRWCIQRGRIVAAIPEAVLAAELLPKEERVKLIVAVGTRRAAVRQPITPGRLALVQEGFRLGFRALHYPRIAYGDLIDVQPSQWAIDEVFPIEERQARASKFIRHFRRDRPLRQLDRRPDGRRRGLLRAPVRAELPGQRDVPGPRARRRDDPLRRLGPGQRDRADRRLDRSRRDRRRLGARLGRARGGRREAADGADRRPVRGGEGARVLPRAARSAICWWRFRTSAPPG